MLSVLITFGAHGQNMVPNPGFENYNTCPAGIGCMLYSPAYTDFTYIQDWICPLDFSRSDYFHVCATVPDAGVPRNYFGYQPPHGGNGYAGIVAWLEYPASAKPYMSYIETKLTRAMVAGHKYRVSLWANVSAYYNVHFTWVGINKLGVHFSDTLLWDPVARCITASTDVADTTVFVADSARWIQVKGIYTATANSLYMTVGHFDDDAVYHMRDTVLRVGTDPEKFSYVYIDDVSVVPFPDTQSTRTTYCTHVLPYTIGGLKETGKYLWNTGDTTRSLVVDSLGWYNSGHTKYRWYIRQTFTFPDSAYRIDSVLVIYTPVLRIVGDDTTVCRGISVKRWANYSDFTNYSWSSGDNTDTISLTTPATYILTATDVCGDQKDTFRLANFSKTPPPVVHDTLVCLRVVIPPLGVQGQNIKWYLQPNDVTGTAVQPVLQTSRPGYDTVYVSQTLNGCEGTKARILIHIIRKPVFQLGVNDTVICNAKYFYAGKPDNSISFIWNTGETECCKKIDAPGIYILDGSNVCGHSYDTLEVVSYPCDSCLWAPNAFTPNGDGRNDVFNIKVRCPISGFKFIIYNRYGQAVFRGDNQRMGWDGTQHGVPQDPGVYFFFVQLETGIPGDDPKLLKGDITLIK